jgi:hypothetical protein
VGVSFAHCRNKVLNSVLQLGVGRQEAGVLALELIALPLCSVLVRTLFPDAAA